MKAWIIFFDGYCLFCSRSVRLVYRNDPGKKFRFAPLDSELCSEKISEFKKSYSELPDSIVLYTGSGIYIKSAAALRIAVRMSFPWPLFGIFFIIPRFLRDPFYDLIARKRYKWFGKSEKCFVPDKEMKERFML